jgi:hypothetical protein
LLLVGGCGKIIEKRERVFHQFKNKTTTQQRATCHNIIDSRIAVKTTVEFEEKKEDLLKNVMIHFIHGWHTTE